MASQNSYNKEKIRDYIIDINNRLFELKGELKLFIPEIKKITQESILNDNIRKQIIDIVKDKEDDIQARKKEEIRRMSILASGIEDREVNESITYSEYVAEALNRSLENGGLKPPKTDWKRIDISKDEKEKILESIRANPKSNPFSKEFKWNPKDFLDAFLYLENNNGPFLVSVVNDKNELEKYSKIPELSEEVSNIFVGKFVLLSIYDITATSRESKYIYMGIKYDTMLGTLSFGSLGSIDGVVASSQKRIAIEFMDEMKISYDLNHKDLLI